MKINVKEKLVSPKTVYLLPFNRTVEERPDLRESMIKFGFLVPVLTVKTDVIDGVSRIWAVDGQHRTEEARMLEMEKIPVNIIQSKFNNKEELVSLISTLNTTSKPWKLEDFLHAFNCIGTTGYNKISDLHREYPQVSLEYKINMYNRSRLPFNSTNACISDFKKGKVKLLRTNSEMTHLCNLYLRNKRIGMELRKQGFEFHSRDIFAAIYKQSKKVQLKYMNIDASSIKRDLYTKEDIRLFIEMNLKN